MLHEVGFTNSLNFKCLEDLREYNLDMNLTYCGMEDCSPGHNFGPQKRSAYVIHVVTKGKGKYYVNNKVYEITKNQAFMIEPDNTIYYEADRYDPWSYIWIGIKGIKVKDLMNRAGLSKQHPVNTYVRIETLKQYVMELLNAHELTYANELRRYATLILFISTLIDDNKYSIKMNW